MKLPLLHRSVFPKDVTDEVETFAEEFESLRQEEAERITRYRDYREENELSRVADVFGTVADTQDYGHSKTQAVPSRHNIPLPFGLALNIKHGFRIFGQLPDSFVDRRTETVLERYRSDTVEKIVWAIIRASGSERLFKDGAWDGSQLGATCFDFYFDEGKQLPILRSIDPEGILVVKGVDDPHNFSRVYRFWKVPVRSVIAEYGDKMFRDIPIPVTSLTEHFCTFVQATDKQKTIRFVIDGFESGDDLKALPLYERHHGLGFCPYVVIPNIGPERDVWGWADYELVRGLVHYIPTLFSREADLMRATAGGAFIEKGTGQAPDRILNIVRRGGIIPSKRDGSVEPVDTPDVPAFAADHAERGLQMMKMLGFAPDAAWGDGQAGSGSDRGLQLQPLLELTAMKQANWSSGLTRVFNYALRLLEKEQRLPTAYSGSVGRGRRRVPFVLPELGPELEAQTITTGQDPDTGEDIQAELPRTLKELFDGEYEVRFSWQNRIDPDDPAYVSSELAKFQQGAQSLRTTLENLGVQNPEDEMLLIEQEAERFPWLNQGAIALIKAELQAMKGAGQGVGGGAPPSGGDPLAALDSFSETDTAATDADFAASAAGVSDGPLYGRA